MADSPTCRRSPLWSSVSCGGPRHSTRSPAPACHPEGIRPGCSKDLSVRTSEPASVKARNSRTGRLSLLRDQWHTHRVMTLDECRRFYAEEIRFVANIDSPALIAALARVPRENSSAPARGKSYFPGSSRARPPTPWRTLRSKIRGSSITIY